ncbi:MAG: TRM11 family SAM-dependent methyltransferase [Propionibacteriaceae bacterium]
MTDHALLLAPSANRVYAGESDKLAAAELEICLPQATDIAATMIAGVPYLTFSGTDIDAATVGRLSASLALFERSNDLLGPIAMTDTALLPDDLVTIPKYQGKTNEQFTRLLLNVTLSQIVKPRKRRIVLDPLAGRGTTLSEAWRQGCDACGVEGDDKSVEAYASFLKTYLRRGRYKHTATLTPVRREGRAIGQRFDATLSDSDLNLTVFTGDTRDSSALFGKKKFDAIVCDAPYGIVHGAHSDVRGGFGHKGKDRSPAGLLREAIPVWASQLIRGGAMGISWNTFGLSREDLAALMSDAGLEVCADGPWERFGHRVDSAIHRDLIVGVKGFEE